MSSTSTSPRPIAVRVSEALHQEISLLAAGLSTTMADQVRAALDGYILMRLMDEALPQQVAEAKARFARTLEALTAPNPEVPESVPAAKKQGIQLSVRLDEEHLSRLMSLALLDDTTVADQLRCALERHVRESFDDPHLADHLTVAAADRASRGDVEAPDPDVEAETITRVAGEELWARAEMSALARAEFPGRHHLMDS